MSENITLIKESILHWERMIESCKWLVESGFNEYHFERYITERHGADGCPLCQKYLKTTFGICAFEWSAYQKVMRHTDTKTFIELSEKHMIPALRKCLEIEIEKEKYHIWFCYECINLVTGKALKHRCIYFGINLDYYDGVLRPEICIERNAKVIKE